MERPSKKIKHIGRASEPVEKLQRKEDLVKKGSSKIREAIQEETSEENEVNYPNQPPIQNGFVVFIHQLNLASSSKEKRTVVEWISDALKMLDVSPEVITVDKLMEDSIATGLKPKVPIIKFSRPAGEVENSTGVNASKLRRGNARQSQSKRKIQVDKSKTTTAAAGGSAGQNPSLPTWKGGKVVPQKSLHSSSSKSLQRKSVRPVKNQEVDDKKQMYGVQLSVLKEKVRTMQCENNHCIWVLLVESRRRCIVDMGKLNTLASKFRFKVRWIAAQAPRSLDQSVFSVVNDIVQTKNICFPEQMKGPRRKDPDDNHKNGKGNASKDIEILHKTLSANFDVSSYASFDTDQITKIKDRASSSGPQEMDQTPEDGKGEKSEEKPGEEETDEGKSGKVLPPPEASVQDEDEKTNVNTSDSNDSPTTKSSDSSSLFEIRSTNKNFTTLYNTTVQMALISTNNPFASPYTRTDLPDFHGLPIPSDLKRKEFTLSKSVDSNGNKMLGIPSASRSVVVVVRDMTKSDSGLATLLKNMLRREGINSYTISISNLLDQHKAVELMESLALNSGYDPGRDVTIGCKILIQKALEYKLAENKHPVVIVDVSDESFVRMWSVFNYGVKLGHKCLTLEKKADGVFENNLRKVFQTVRRRLKRRNLYTWPSHRHSATTASSDDLLYKPENIEGMGRDLGFNKQVLLSAKSVRFAVNASKLKVSSDGGRASADCIFSKRNESQPEFNRVDERPIRDTTSASFGKAQSNSLNTSVSRTIKNAWGNKQHHTELPDILGGTTALENDTVDSDTDPLLATMDTSREAKGQLSSTYSDKLKGDDESGAAYSVDDQSLSETDESDTTKSLTDDSSVDSNFLTVLKESMLMTMTDGVPPKFSEKYLPGADEEDDTDASSQKCRDTRMENLITNSAQRLKAYLDADISTTTSEEDGFRVEDLAPNHVISSSRTSLKKHRTNLLEIHRCKHHKENTGGPASSTSDENLFKGWVALPGKASELNESRKGFFVRTHSRLTGLFQRICTCGRKVRRKM